MPNRVEHIRNTHRGHGYQLTIVWAQFFEGVYLADEAVVRTEDVFVDGKPIYGDTPGYVSYRNNPDAGVRQYINFLEDGTLGDGER